MNKPVQKTRWYAHGDLVSDEPKRYYCASCDCFEIREHFAEHETGPCKTNLDKHKESLKKWQEKYSKLPDYHRPSNAPNLFA